MRLGEIISSLQAFFEALTEQQTFSCLTLNQMWVYSILFARRMHTEKYLQIFQELSKIDERIKEFDNE